jgi:hypothetical protein
VLCALYNRAQPQGMGYLHFTPEAMSREEAAEHLAGSQRFDYLKGRVMKVDIGGDEFEPYLFDRDNGSGAAARAIAGIPAA